MTRKQMDNDVFTRRMKKYDDEMRWLYMELYDNSSMYAELCDRMKSFFDERQKDLKKRDEQREIDKDWYRGNDMLGMMFYIENFGGNLKGVEKRLDYIDECFAIAAYLIENGQLAMYETMEAIKEYEAKYGKMGEGEQ